MNVSPELVRPVIEAKIQAAIVAELQKTSVDWVLGGLVSKALGQKVDQMNGQPSTYSSAIPLLEWLCKDAVQKVARQAIAEWIEANRSIFQKHFEAEMKKNSKSMAKVFFDGVTESMKSTWQFKVDVGFQSPEKGR